MSSKIQQFEQLTAWQKAQDLAVKIYKTTNHFPQSEQFGLTNQIRRSATSVSANIAEGFGRATSKDKVHFYTIAYGSLLETKNFVLLSQKLGYLDENLAQELTDRIVDCQKLLNGLIRSTKK